MTEPRSVLHARDLGKYYDAPNGGAQVTVLESFSLDADAGELVVVHGPSGSGKSTLLLMLGGMLEPTKGTVRIDGDCIYSMDVTRRTAFRARSVGFVFQDSHLIPYLNLMENVMAPVLANASMEDPGGRARDLLARLGLEHRMPHRPSALSAGERQRVALARALLAKPKLILADEPTGNLDRENSEIVLGSLRDYAMEGGTVIMATHDEKTIAETERTIRIQ